MASFNGMVRGNTFHDGYNNLGRLAATGLTLENNVFYNSECGTYCRSTVALPMANIHGMVVCVNCACMTS